MGETEPSLKQQLAQLLSVLKRAVKEPTPENVQLAHQMEHLRRLGFTGRREPGDEELIAKLHEHIALAREELLRRGFIHD
jgi:hypothetical protein